MSCSARRYVAELRRSLMSGRRSSVSVGVVVIVLLVAVVLGLGLSPTDDSPVNAVGPDIAVRRGIGQVDFGATEKEIEKVFGPPSDMSPSRDAMIYRNHGLVFYLNRQGRLSRFEAVSAAANLSIDHDFSGTIQGWIRIGSPAADVVECFGTPTSAKYWDGDRLENATWDHVGLTMYFDDYDRLAAMSVEAP